ncbi:hypothetical protein Q31b_06780 [Novipirellula aureliae]|uniref:Transposase DDE domain-containing protein n=1 Tax=Novipirellula aureliae TaxID=2527966 RepID=A0A5C6EAG5_9BACT|nr:hypothetical protein Q31b_06780 [Novipirellula aureliae]
MNLVGTQLGTEHESGGFAFSLTDHCGRRSVFHRLLMKVAGWNIQRAASSKKLMERLAAFFFAFLRRLQLIAKRDTVCYQRNLRLLAIC